MRVLEGGCKVPIGGIATTSNGRLHLTGCVLSADGKTRLESTRTGKPDNASSLGIDVGNDLLAQGARELEKSWRELLR